MKTENSVKYITEHTKIDESNTKDVLLVATFTTNRIPEDTEKTITKSGVH